jgi:hypothetical protein
MQKSLVIPAKKTRQRAFILLTWKMGTVMHVIGVFGCKLTANGVLFQGRRWAVIPAEEQN